MRFTQPPRLPHSVDRVITRLERESITVSSRALVAAPISVAVPLSWSTAPPPRNEVIGTWRMISAHTERNGPTESACGKQPSGMLASTRDVRHVEVLTDSSLPLVTSEVRGDGTDQKYRLAMAGIVGMFDTCTVEADGRFRSNRVGGATFPDLIGDVRTTDDLRIVDDRDGTTENFTRLDGHRITIAFERVR